MLLLSVVCLGLQVLAADAAGLPVLRPYVGVQPAPVGRIHSEVGCDDGSVGGTLIQSLEEWYGNAFTAPCGGARVTHVRFQHMSYGLSGPYLYRLHLLDSACQLLVSTPLLETESGDGEPTWVDVDVSNQDWCVAGDYQIFLEPLTCADALSGADCFPALVVDSTSSPEPGTHCAVVNTPSLFGRACGAARSADGRYFDFLLRAEVDCAAASCSTGLQATSWSLIKSLYASP